MKTRPCAVIVKELPPKLNARQLRSFFRELVGAMDERPCVVLDCSAVRELEKPMIYLLLCCLEEAIKRNGDVRLAALPPAMGKSLARAGLDRLFEVLDTAAEAVNSFGGQRDFSPVHAQASSRGGSKSAS